MNKYPLDTLVTLSVTFTDKKTKALVDPTVVFVVVRDSLGNETTYNYPADITQISQGVYECEVVATIPGAWGYRWVGDGDDISAPSFDQYFNVYVTSMLGS